MNNISPRSRRNNRVPHVIVKLWPGKSDHQKQRLSDAIVRDVAGIFHYDDESVSVAFEEIAPGEWSERVFNPDILGKWDSLTKEPGYGPRPSDNSER
jgi:4-oxalocrotonate tautomerase